MPGLIHIRRRARCGAAHQRGMFLIEAVVALLLFMLGVLGMVGLSAQAVSTQSDAEYRTLAAQWASQLAQQAWVNVDRVSGADRATRAANVATSLNTFQHQPDGDDCGAFGGATSTNSVVTNWIAAVQDAQHGGLPGTGNMQQVRVDTTADGHNKMTITVCWKAPDDQAVRRHVFATLIN